MKINDKSCHVRFNILNTVYKSGLTLRKFNLELKLRNTEKTFGVGNGEHENWMSKEIGVGDWNKTVVVATNFKN